MGPSLQFWRHLSSSFPAFVWFPGAVISMQVWTVGTSRGQLWGFGQGFLYEAPKPEVRRGAPRSVAWLQSCVVHRAHHLGDAEGFVQTQLCWETLGDSHHWHCCALSEMPSPYLFLLLLLKINLWRVCWMVFSGEQNLSFLVGTQPLSVWQPWH